MTLSIKRLFAAASLAGLTAAGYQFWPQEPQALDTDSHAQIVRLGDTMSVVMGLAQNGAVAAPNMAVLGTQALQDYADKSVFDEFTLSKAERARLELQAARGNERSLELFETHGDILTNMLTRAASAGTPLDKVVEAGHTILHATVSAIDAHSSYLTEKETEEMSNRTAGNFGGIGLQVQLDENDRVVIGGITEGGPAEKAGLKAEDIITHVDGIAIKGMPLPEAVARMRGAVDTTVSLTVERRGVPVGPLMLTRAVIETSPVTGRAIGDDIAYVRLDSFNQKSTQDMEAAIRNLQKEQGGNIRGLVLDLRGNPGGVLSEAISISDLFLESGRIVSVGNGTADDRVLHARAGDILNGAPIAVLIDFGSASASEIVASALQQNNRATIVGTQSYGKGSVQAVMHLSYIGKALGLPKTPEGGLRLTTQLYFSPSGESIQGRGVTPDIRFENDEIRQLQRKLGDKIGESARKGSIANPTHAAAHHSAALCEPAPDQDPAKTDESLLRATRGGQKQVDSQLACAVEMLRGQSVLTVTRPLGPNGPQI